MIYLKLVLQSELHLSRRSGIARCEAGVRDNSKGIAITLCNPPGLSEVRVIEHVKNFPPEFDHLAFSQFRAFNQRQV
jgi:hypothetical protein